MNTGGNVTIILITNIIACWQRNEWAAFYGHFSKMTPYELQECAAMLHSIARSMEVHNEERLKEGRDGWTVTTDE